MYQQPVLYRAVSNQEIEFIIDPCVRFNTERK